MNDTGRPPADSPATPGAVDWDLARRTSAWMVSRRRPPAHYDHGALQAQFDELTAKAEALVISATGLRPTTGPARARVTDRQGWVEANVASIQRLVGPALERFATERRGQLAGLAPRLGAPLAGLSRSAGGVELGAVLAYMATRVLGQYDLLLTDEAADDQDLVYFVGPNIVALEERHGFPPDQFRLWLAIHEVTHRCQFTAVPWLRGHFVSLIDRGLEPNLADPRHLADAVRRATDELRAGRNPLSDAGVLGLVAGPEQLEVLRGIQALMSLLEGHGDVTMDRAGAAAIPGAARFSRILHERRQQVRGPVKLLHQVLGLEAKLRQYAEGEEFVNAVERAGGTDLLDRVWRGPEWLPTLTEIRTPSLWVERIGVGGPGTPRGPALLG